MIGLLLLSTLPADLLEEDSDYVDSDGDHYDEIISPRGYTASPQNTRHTNSKQTAVKVSHAFRTSPEISLADTLVDKNSSDTSDSEKESCEMPQVCAKVSREPTHSLAYSKSILLPK